MTTTPDPHLSHYSDRAASFAPSPIRQVFETSMQPGILSLAGGNPALEALDLEAIAEFSARVIRERGLDALQYGSSEGTSELQQLITEVMGAEGIATDPDRVLVTSGSQMALQLVGSLFVNPGDLVLAEAPTYVGALSVFGGLQAEVAHVPTDEGGLVVEGLRRVLQDARAAGRRIAFLYTIPNFHNPTGLTLAAERRPEVVALAREFGVLIVEDNPYGLLRYDGEPLPSLYSLDPENVLYLGSFSKIFAPGLRVGWVVAPPAVKARLLLAEEATAICPPVLSQLIAEEYIRAFDWRSQLRKYIEVYRERRDSLLAALAEHMPEGTSWTTPEGGFFTWVRLGDYVAVSSDALMQPAIEAQVAFIPGTAFYAGDGSGAGASATAPGTRELRLAFSFVDAEVASEAVRRLARVITEQSGAQGRAQGRG
ncbi:PLP-dependent aminotransferase family protein [Micrococcales bacterium 31B]|nr:PLP-dependent aminotransferase family protein [Micrococcales bacterium 31B]